jgi:uncharacterized protein YegL
MQHVLRVRQLLLHSLFLGSLIGLAACSRDEASDRAVRTTSTKTEVSVGGLVRTRTERTVTEPVSERLDVADRDRPQSGLLTAGDYDDLLNPELYAEYAGKFLQASGKDLPFVDTRTRVTVTVVGATGRPVPFAKVEVERDWQPLRLTAAADGTASFFPTFDDVPAKTKIRVASEAGTARQMFNLASARNVEIRLPGATHSVSALDLALVMDTTGSMGDEIDYLQAELDTIIDRLKRDAGNLDLRIGIIVYRDEGDDYVVRSIPLSDDLRSVRTSLAEQSANGGGDEPEALDQAMIAADRMQWRRDAAKAVLLVADAPPHELAIGATLKSAQSLRSKGVHIVPVAASGVEDTAQYVMRTMAALTQGRYIFLTDDSGVGNPHEEPDVACYVVSRLDQLIARVLAGLADGRRVEPAQDEVIRVVGDYDRGRCRAQQGIDQS